MPTITTAATLGFSKLDLETALKHLSALGFRKVEITELGFYCRHFPYKETDVDDVKKLLDKYHLTAVSMNVSTVHMVDGEPYFPKFTNSKDAEFVLEYAQWFLEKAHQLGIKIVTIPIGPRVFGEEWKTETDAACEGFKKITEVAHGYGLSLNLEVPHLYQITDTVEHVKYIFDKIDHPAMGATVDSSHWGIIGYDVEKFFHDLGPKLRHIHLRDSRGEDTKDCLQDLELTPGKGTVDFDRLAKAIDDIDYKGEVAFDLEYRVEDLDYIVGEYKAAIENLKQRGWDFDLA